MFCIPDRQQFMGNILSWWPFFTFVHYPMTILGLSFKCYELIYVTLWHTENLITKYRPTKEAILKPFVKSMRWRCAVKHSVALLLNEFDDLIALWFDSLPYNAECAGLSLHCDGLYQMISGNILMIVVHCLLYLLLPL